MRAPRSLVMSTLVPILVYGGLAHGGTTGFTNVTTTAGLSSAVNDSQGTGGFLSGGAVGDFNNDGWQDIYFPVGGGAPDMLFINNQDGTFTDMAADWGIDLAHRGTAATVGDFDDDGWLDLYVTSLGPTDAPPSGTAHLLYRNQSGSGFVDVAAEAGVNALTPPVEDGYGAAFGDYDLDGDLDLGVASWDGSNRLFRNDGDGTFTDVTLAAGLTTLDDVRGFAPRIVDMNGDRYPELLWVGDFGTTQYWINDGDGTFTNFTTGSGTALAGTEMGHTVADFDHDGLFDWYVTTINNNKLYMNQGNHIYVDQASTAGVVNSGWGWATVTLDFDHDGLPDIAATSQSSGQYLFRNETSSPGDPAFTEMAATAGLSSGVSGRGLANFDYDNDGDQDLVFFPRNDPMQLFRNDLVGPATNWLRVFLDTSEAESLPPAGVGAVIEIAHGGTTCLQRIDGGSNYLSQSEMSAHFGLGDTAIVDTLTVHWTDGTTTALNNVAANQTLTLHAGPSCATLADCADIDGNGIRDDNCIWWLCDHGACAATDIPFADMGGQFGECPPDNAPDGNDRFHALNCFADLAANGEPGYPCEDDSPNALNVDAGGPFGDCAADGVCDGNDAFHALNAFGGASPCSCPLDGGPTPEFAPHQTESASVSLRAHDTVIRQGETIEVEVRLATPLHDLRGYQLHLGVSGGTSGTLELIDVAVDHPTVFDRGGRADGVARGTPWSAFNLTTGQVVVGLDSPGVTVEPGTLARFSFKASARATGRFTIDILHDGADPTQRTFLFPTPATGRIGIDDSKPLIVAVSPPQFRRQP